MKLLSTLLLAISSTAFAVTLPCATHSSRSAVCSDASFTSAVRQLSTAYQQADKQLSTSAVSAMNADAKAWLAWTDTMCPPHQAATQRGACLLPLYKNQIKMLDGGVVKINGTQFYPRLKVIISPETSGPRPDIHDPGYGSGRLTWPQIDRPSHTEARWNAAAAKEASWLISEGGKITSDNPFSPAPLTGKQVFISYRIAAANHRLIVLTFTRLVFPYGAAHPDSTVHTMNWWLRRKRMLRTNDVFRKGSDWRPLLAKTGYNRLVVKAKRDKTLPYIFPAKESLPAARKAINNTVNWTLCRNGLIITFPPYSVAAGVYGSPSVLLPWRSLKPYLNRHLHAATLPTITQALRR